MVYQCDMARFSALDFFGSMLIYRDPLSGLGCMCTNSCNSQCDTAWLSHAAA